MTGHADRDAVTKLVFRYAELVDEGAFATVAKLFEHATFRAVVGADVYTRTGAHQVREQFERMVITYDGVPSTKHLTTNVVVEVDGEWRFTDRLIFSDLVGDLSHHLRQNPL